MTPRSLSLPALTLGLLLAGSSAHAEPPPPPGKTVTAKLSCGSVQGVVVCVVRLEPYPRSVLRWAEGSFASTPKFLRPIKNKTTYTHNPTKSPTLFLGLEPTGHGEGEVAVLVRSVSCTDEEGACSHQALTVRTRVSVPKP